MENPFEVITQRLDRIEELLVKLTDKMEELPWVHGRLRNGYESVRHLSIVS